MPITVERKGRETAISRVSELENGDYLKRDRMRYIGRTPLGMRLFVGREGNDIFLAKTDAEIKGNELRLNERARCYCSPDDQPTYYAMDFILKEVGH